MGTKGFKLFFQEDEEDYLDDPITLFDFEENTVFYSSKEFLRNITIEDPGDVVSISEEDFEEQLKSLLQLKELKRLKEKNGNLLRKCRSCSIKVIDCHKFPWYYQNKIGATKKTQYLNTEQNVAEIEGNDKAEITITDLTENEHVVYDNQNDNGRREEYTNNKEKEANRSEFTNVGNESGREVRRQSNQRLSKPVLNTQNESHTKLPKSEAEQATDLIISTYTRLTDKAIQKLKSSIESNENSKNLRQGNFLLLGSKRFKNSDNLLKDTKKNIREAKVPKDNENNDCDNVHKKKINNKKCNKIKNIYTSEQISKTKIKIKKKSLKSKAIIYIQNHYKEIKDKERNLNAVNRDEYVSLKNIGKNATNQNKQNNKQERVQHNSYSYPSLSSPVLTNTTHEKNNSTSFPNGNIDPDRFHGCNKPFTIADRIIPHFHENAFLNHPDVLFKTKSNTKCSKATIHIHETKENITTFDSNEALNTGSLVSQMPHLVNNNTMVNNNGSHYRNVAILNISAIHSVSPSQVTCKLPVNNGILLKRSTHAFPDVVKENLNNFMRHSKEITAQLEKERLLYLLPSNLPPLHIQNII